MTLIFDSGSSGRHAALVELTSDATPQWLRRLMRMEAIGAAMRRADGRCLASNAEFSRITGVDPQQLSSAASPHVALPVRDHTVSSDDPVFIDYVRRDGVHVPVALTRAKLQGEYEVEFVVDLSERMAAQRELAFRARLLDNVPGMVGYWDRELRNRYANKAYLDWFGLAPEYIFGKHIREIIGEARYELNLPYMLAALQGTPQLFEREITDPTGTLRSAQARYIPDVVDGEVPGFFVLVTDVTPIKRVQAELEAARTELEQRVADRTATLAEANEELRKEIAGHKQTQEALNRAQEQLQQSRRLEAIGRLSGGIAHDFNNLLTVIQGTCDVMLARLRAGDCVPSVLHHINAIDQAAGRAEDLTRQLLAFSRKQALRPRRIDVHESLRDATVLVRRLIGEDIEVVLRMEARIPTVRFDPSQFDQVILNLAANARDAMPKGGTFTLATTNEGPDPGAVLVLSIEDSGEGMSPENLEHIFEPFFTTKELGRGTGLGLSTVHGIVTQSGGEISVKSEPGRGTRFQLRIPTELGPPDPAQATKPKVGVGGTERIMIVDDDANVRSFVAEALRAAGYDVLEAAGTEEAQRIFAAQAVPIDLLLTDVVMPGGTGPELASWFRTRSPATRLLLMSGYDAPELRSKTTGTYTIALRKPFRAGELLSCVRSALDVPLSNPALV